MWLFTKTIFNKCMSFSGHNSATTFAVVEVCRSWNWFIIIHPSSSSYTFQGLGADGNYSSYREREAWYTLDRCRHVIWKSFDNNFHDTIYFYQLPVQGFLIQNKVKNCVPDLDPFGWVVLVCETDRPAVCKKTNGCGLPFQNFKATNLKVMQDLEGLRCL